MSSRIARGIGTGAAVLAGLYGYRVVRYWRLSRRGFTLPEPPKIATPEFFRLVETLTGAPVRLGNRVRLLRNGDQIFPAMLESIRAARSTIDFATYIYWSGDIAERFADALAERAAAGVEVNVLLDAVGAHKMDDRLVDRMKAAGVHLAWFRPPRWFLLERFKYRTHRKLLVVDGVTGFTGGVGIADEWTGHAQDPAHWRDTHVRVDGPAARDLLGGFQENWSEATGVLLAPRHLSRAPSFDDGVPVQTVRSSATQGRTEAEELFWAAIAGSTRRLWLTSAYFAPRRAFVDALCAAARRGVDVRLLSNGPHTDRRVVRQASRWSFRQLLESGVRVWEYRRTMLHAKVMTADGEWATVGSMNFDHRSFSLNDELNLSFASRDLVYELERDFVKDLEEAHEITLDEWTERPLPARARELASAAMRQEL